MCKYPATYTHIYAQLCARPTPTHIHTLDCLCRTPKARAHKRLITPRRRPRVFVCAVCRASARDLSMHTCSTTTQSIHTHTHTWCCGHQRSSGSLGGRQHLINKHSASSGAEVTGVVVSPPRSSRRTEIAASALRGSCGGNVRTCAPCTQKRSVCVRQRLGLHCM